MPADDELITRLGLDAESVNSRVHGALLRLVNEVAQLENENARLRAQNAELGKLADQDGLMPICNRRAFLRELSRQNSQGRRHGTVSSVLYLDLDNLKRINDRFGHAAGDAALAQIGRILIARVRHEDVVARLGGDEFGILLVGSDRGAAEEKAASLALAIATTPLLWNQVPVLLGASIGAHEIGQAETPEESLQSADLAMYASKHAGRPIEALGHAAS